MEMDLVIEFAKNNIDLVYFVCGLAFFTIGLAAALESRRSSSLRLVASLPLLAACGVLFGMVYWAEMLLVGQSLYASDRAYGIQVVRVLLFAAGALCLGQFGAELVSVESTGRQWLRWLPASLFMLWLFGSLVPYACWMPVLPPEGPAPTGQAGLDAGGSASAYAAYWLTDAAWLTEVEGLARYLLYLPGGLLAAVAAFRLRSLFLEMNLPQLTTDASGAAIVLALNSLIVGLVSPVARYFPDSIINYRPLFVFSGVPTLLLTTISAMALAWFTVRLLRVFAIEQERELERVNIARYEAQQELLEAQRVARVQTELWNQQLESEIERRTAELGRLNRELEVTNAIAVAVSQSLRLEDVLNTTLDKVMEVMQVRVGGVHIVDFEAGSVKYSVSRGLYHEYLRRTDIVGLGGGFAERVIESDQPLLVEDISNDPRVAELVIEREGVQSFASVPLKSKGRVLGAMSIVSHSPRVLTRDDVHLLRVIANQIAVAIDNAQLFEETRRREREAEALYRVGREVSSLLDVDKILDSVVENVRQLIGTEAAALALVDERTQEVFMKATIGIRTEAFKKIRMQKGEGLAGKVIETGQPVKIEDYEASPDITHRLDDIVRAEGLMAHLAAPLKMGGKVMGALYALEHRVHHFSDHDVNLLVGLASQAAIAIENARLYDQVQQLAILSERGRIAREMHDGVAQVLGYLVLNFRMLAGLLSEGRVVEAAEELEKMREIVREAYNDVRASILGLRTSASIAKGLMPGLLEFLEDYSHQTGIQAELVMGSSDGIAFAPAVETQLVRIVQEALSNTRKHAQATRAWVRMELDGEQACITIEDNGRGFEMPENGELEGHFGLEIMRERAESVGGKVEVQSSPGSGTKVIVKLPCALASGTIKGLGANRRGIQ